LLLALAGCGTPEQCVYHSNKHYVQGLAKVLAQQGVATSVGKDKGLCFAKRDFPKVTAAAQELDKYFFKVADFMADACAEKALVDWATQEGLLFEVRELKSPGGRPGKLFNIYSFSQQEMIANRKKLMTEAPRSQTCPR
jgi:hypothetical protein